ncbi:MAG: hypothetical protein JWM41_1020 [Gemmatimonadetes bacterium]|nr:hypothetical protein [Gemmatimonadota bacterium]
MPVVLKPWEIHPSLTLERLLVVGEILWRVRRQVALRIETKKGDTLWGAGCSSFERTCFALTQAAAGPHREWLAVDRKEGHFVVKIGGVPLRFYRAVDEELAPMRYAEACASERAALQTAFDLIDTPTPDHVFRLEVITDSLGMPTIVSLAQIDSARARSNVFEIPIRIAASATVSRKAPIQLPAAKVSAVAERPQVIPIATAAQAKEKSS